MERRYLSIHFLYTIAQLSFIFPPCSMLCQPYLYTTYTLPMIASLSRPLFTPCLPLLALVSSFLQRRRCPIIN